MDTLVRHGSSLQYLKFHPAECSYLGTRSPADENGQFHARYYYTRSSVVTELVGSPRSVRAIATPTTREELEAGNALLHDGRS
jgi:hypothetical protein